MVDSSDKTWSTEEGNGKPLQPSGLMKRYDTERWTPQAGSAQYATAEEQRNSSRRNEEAEPKGKQCPTVDASGGESKVWCCKAWYCTGTWNVRSLNQGELEVVKQEKARVNIDILGVSEL